MDVTAEICDRPCLACDAPNSCTAEEDLCSACQGEFDELKRTRLCAGDGLAEPEPRALAAASTVRDGGDP